MFFGWDGGQVEQKKKCEKKSDGFRWDAETKTTTIHINIYFSGVIASR